jgi:Iap family predicted aminopeptidase
MRSLGTSDAVKIVFCLNADSIGGRIGQNTALCTGMPEMSDYFRRKFAELNYAGEVRDEVSPYSDHFPLNICGVPSLWITRLSLFKSSYWTLHSVHDRLDNINLDVCAQTISVYGRILLDLAECPQMPFMRKISPRLKRDVREVAKKCYRHPWNPKY